MKKDLVKLPELYGLEENYMVERLMDAINERIKGRFGK